MQEIIEWLAAQWISRFKEITFTMGDLQLSMHVNHMDAPPKEALLWWEQPFTCSPKHPIWIGAPEETWLELGKHILKAAGVESAPPSEAQSTYLEIVRQSMGSLAQDIGDRITAQVSPGTGSQSAPETGAPHTLQIDVGFPQRSGRFYLVSANELCRFVASHSAQASGAAALVLAPKASDDSDAGQTLAAASRTFDLLLDVELPVSVSFGRASLKLQDAMKLITGSLIELDRSVTDPVELLVNNCVIARGEVVVVEGNYGVRITEIVSQKERLQQTRRYMLQ
jgi:flagellar motor switch protein FliN/FliY